MTPNELDIKLRDAALRYLLNAEVSPMARYEAEQMFAYEIDIFVAGARCAFKMIIDHKIQDKED